MSSDKKLVGTTIITAIAASLCCITPVLALIAGTSGIASTFTWIEPFRPYLIGLTVLVLAVAWYQKLKPKNQDIDCVCDDEKPKFSNSKKFLLLVTLFAGLMLAFPYYTQLFYPTTNKEVVYVTESNIDNVEYQIKGMTCSGCEVHIESEVNKLDGIIKVKANHEKGNTVVTYDKTKVTNQEIEDAVGKTGYKIIK
ncbi:mercuric transport protein MerTP [Flavobacteriaceae bacterium KMM 6897]|nr:mercuric transport protein MerTP [Flavobacteriaceae bacterium KMM 6897]